ncbi:DUF397 domain-containing protein [Streptomyces sp. NPDC057456]|uniref:DUF397 domain-containing protein n=1 Tax=Streptomyces sp. NPDC057456 TaxID=3346139 RepID=UPI0036941AD1
MAVTLRRPYPWARWPWVVFRVPLVANRPGTSGCSSAAVHNRPLVLLRTIWTDRGIGRAEVVHGGQPLWRRSSRCGNESECVEVAMQRDHVLARDSKTPAQPALTFTAGVWSEFLDAMRAEVLQSP